MTSKSSIDSYECLGSVSLNSAVPDLLSWCEMNSVDMSLIEIDRVPRIGFRVGWASDSRREDVVVLDVCRCDLVNPQPNGAAEERTVISRFEITNDQAMALAHLLLAAAKRGS